MKHVDPDQLALLAIGEPASPEDAAHLAACAECRAERDAFARTVAVGRSLTPDDLEPPAPPSELWDRIAADVGAPSADPAAGHGDGPDAPVVPIEQGRRTRRAPARRWAVAAAVVAVVVVAASVVAVVRDGGDGERTVQSVALSEVDGSGASGRADIVRNGNGYTLRVDTTGLSARSGSYYELWLMNPATDSFVSLGPVVPGTRSTHPLPAGVSTRTDPFVDVSVEPLDGDPAHSTISVLRGEFA